MHGSEDQNFQRVDHSSALTVEEGKQVFGTPSPRASPRVSVGGQTPPHSSTSSSQSTPITAPRTNTYPKGRSSFGDEFDNEQEKLSMKEGSVGDEQEGPIYATIKKSPGSDSGVRDQNFTPIRRSDSQETVFSPPWDREKSEKSVRDILSNGTSTPSTGSPSRVSTDGSEKLLLSDDEFDTDSTTSKKTNRFWPRAKYAMKQKNFVVPLTSATFIAMYLAAYATLVYLEDKGRFIAFITNNPKFITVPGIIALSLLAIGIFCAIKQFNNTIEHQIHEKDPDKVLKKVLEFQPEGKIINHMVVEHSNGTILHVQYNTWRANKNGIANADEEVIRKIGKIESVFNDRPLFTALLTGFIVANVALPLGLYAAGGISNITTFYQDILATNIGLSLLVASSVIALSILCLGVHYYNKTNCTNLVYLKDSETSNVEVNEKLTDETVEQRIPTLKGSHDQSGKLESLDITNVGVGFYNGKTLSIACR